MDMWTQADREIHHEIRKRYPSDLTDGEWALTVPFFATYRPLSTTIRAIGRGRDGPYGPPPAQIPACGFPAPGSCRRSNATGAGGLGRPLPSRSAGSPLRGHAGSGTGSGACVAARLPSDRPPSLHHLRRRSGSASFEASSVLRSRPTPPAFL